MNENQSFQCFSLDLYDRLQVNCVKFGELITEVKVATGILGEVKR